jgi:hypothetical protein
VISDQMIHNVNKQLMASSKSFYGLTQEKCLPYTVCQRAALLPCILSSQIALVDKERYVHFSVWF